MSVRCPEMYRHPFYPPVSRAELEKRDRLLADFRLGHEDGGAGGSSRSVVTSPKYYSSKGAASGGLLHPLFDDSADCDGPPRSGRLRVQWGSLDNAKTRNKIRRNCLGFTADGNRILAGFKDSVATINPASLSVHSSVPAQGVSFVLPHPTDANVVAVGLQEGASTNPCLCLMDLRHPPRSLAASSSSCTYTSPFSEEWWAGAWHPSGKYLVCADMRDCLHSIEPVFSSPAVASRKTQQPRVAQQTTQNTTTTNTTNTNNNNNNNHNTNTNNSFTPAASGSASSVGGPSGETSVSRSAVTQLDTVTHGCCFCHEGRVLVLSQEDGHCRLLPAGEGVEFSEKRVEVPLVQGPAVVCAASRNGNAFACGGGDGSVHVCEASSASVLASFPKASGAVQCLALSHDAEIAAWACRDRSESGERRGEPPGRTPDFRLTLASVQPAELLQLVETHGCVTDLSFHPNKTLLAVACEGEHGGGGGRYGIGASSASRQVLGIVCLDSVV